ncbi:(2,3-dihydroxybenzoyl)adenylate synthase [Poseidonocella sp. HB161398]|uniref:(2,3-dihydroxybenzoyl)adenylate synthase n=1 Tax=Poseidonocella sp. HB161398 TaxID=2320855 RepID=UPI001109A0F5|nr:(2,3-dihydroxybenzoyl)adenylate synthase [Poseidonocella sp. HB161398]
MDRKLVAFERWPAHLADRYRARGYWLGKPLCHGAEAQARHRPGATAILCGDRAVSYGDLDAQARALAARLAQAGFGHGDTALVQLPNVAEFYIVFQALLKAGIVPINALWSHRQSELASYAEQIRPRLLIADRSHPVFGGNGFAAGCDRLALALYRNAEDPRRDLAAWLDPAGAPAAEFRPTPAGQVAFFQLSGGSTGTPKLIPRTHDDYDYSIRESNRICGVTEATRFLVALPAPHNYLMSSPGALGVFQAGGTVVLAAAPDPQICFPLIARHRIDMVPLVPSAVALWLEAARRDAPDLSSLERMLVGGAAFAEATARQVPGVFGCALQQVFGMAEGLVNYTRDGDDAETVFASQGRPISPDDEIRILDESGREVPEGTPGMLAVRGPYTFRGYYNAPEQNARVFDREGFYYSGDVVERTETGSLRVVGRVKDQINRGGEKIAAEEIENLLLRHPQVRQAALVAVPDPMMGERSCAVIVGEDGLRAPALRRHLMEQGIAEYKIPDRFQFAEALPLTPVGKTDKKALREALARPAPAPVS